MRPLLAFSGLTIRSAFRHRFALALVLLLMVVVVALPMVIKHDGSAQGFTQILITYTLTSITALLGMATLWWSCSVLAREVEDFSLQLVCSKPAPRWQIWLGKWLGIMTLNAVLLTVAGAAIAALLTYQAGSLPEEQRKKLRSEILVARGSARPPRPDLTASVEKALTERMKAQETAGMDREFVRRQIQEQALAQIQYLKPGVGRRWTIPLGAGAAQKLKDSPLSLRVKFFTPDYTGIYTTFNFGWEVGPREGGRRTRFENSFAPESYATFAIPAGLIGPDDTLTVDSYNLNEKPVLFQFEDGIEVLYPVGSFGPNLARGIFIVWCWLGLLAAVGLCAAAKFQFNVAVFVSLSILMFALSGKTLKQVIDQGGIMGVASETGVVAKATWVNQMSVQVYGSIKWVIDQIAGFSPVDALSTGRVVGWDEVARAFLVIIVVAGGFFGVAGVLILTKRELAAPQ